MNKQRQLIWYLLTTMIFFASNSFGQIQVERSEPVDESYSQGRNFLLQLNNGSTFVLKKTARKNFEVSLYDKQRKKTVQTAVEFENVKINDFMLGIYEINGEPVVFFQESYGRSPALYRLRFHPQNCTLIAEDLIYEFPHPGLTGYEDKVSDGFIVAKDPLSDCYAIIIYRGSGARGESRVRVSHYDGHHHMLSNRTLPYPDNSIKNFYVMGVAVNGDKNVFVATYGAESIAYKNGKVYLARISTDDSVPLIRPLEFTNGFKRSNAVLQYNSKRNALQLLVNSEMGPRQAILPASDMPAYSSCLSVIDPETLDVRWAHKLGTDKVTEAKKKKPVADREYSGVTQEMHLCADGSMMILMEELEYQSSTPFGSSATNMTMGDIGMVKLQDDSVEAAGYYLQRRQFSLGTPDPKVMKMHGINFILSDKGMYLLGNEIAENVKRKEEGKRLKTGYNKDRQLVCYVLREGKMEILPLLKKGTQEEDVFADYTFNHDYNPQLHTLAVIAKGNEESGTVVSIRWITLE